MKRALSLLALCLAGCVSAPQAPPTVTPPAVSVPAAPEAAAAVDSAPEPGAEHHGPAYYLALVQGDSDLIDTEKYASGRTRLVADAQDQAERCLALAPQDGQCHYARGIVYGLAAREQPVLAATLLKNMLDSLGKAEALSPGIDHAGPARLQSIVLLRAPSWPLGPGDAEAALAAAKRAVALDPEYPANQSMLREAQKKVTTDK